MNDDYLWDKSGKPDPEIQELEDILGTLLYQPRKLVIPPDVQMARRSFAYRGLAIAAAVALVVLGLGIWMSINRQKPVEFTKAEVKSPEIDNSSRAAAGPDEKKLSNLLANAPKVSDQSLEKVQTDTPRRRVRIATNRSRRLQTSRPQLSESEIAEAMAAKDQLMLALRLASTKLSLAQKKTQGTNDAGEIHNQHKAG